MINKSYSAAFDDVAMHDVQWGANSVNWRVKGKWNEYKQACVSFQYPQSTVSPFRISSN